MKIVIAILALLISHGALVYLYVTSEKKVHKLENRLKRVQKSDVCDAFATGGFDAAVDCPPNTSLHRAPFSEDGEGFVIEYCDSRPSAESKPIGPFVMRDKNGVVRREGSTTDGVRREGVFSYYSADGKKISEEFFVKGKKDGVEISYGPDGLINSFRIFKAGKFAFKLEVNSMLVSATKVYTCEKNSTCIDFRLEGPMAMKIGKWELDTTIRNAAGAIIEKDAATGANPESGYFVTGKFIFKNVPIKNIAFYSFSLETLGFKMNGQSFADLSKSIKLIQK